MLKSQRLIRLMMVINAKKSFTVRELSDEFGLSPRTITRDLQELSEVGFPIYTVQGRGGGYRLLQERMLPPIAFSVNEAVAMFLHANRCSISVRFLLMKVRLLRFISFTITCPPIRRSKSTGSGTE